MQALFLISLLQKAREYKLPDPVMMVLGGIELSNEEQEALTIFSKCAYEEAWDEGYDDCLLDATPKHGAAVV